MAKRRAEITGKVVLYTENGTQIIDAEVRRLYNTNSDTLELKRFSYPEKYLLIAMARTIPSDNIHAAQPCQKTVDTAEKYTRTKFFRLLLDLERLAQFDPISKFNNCMFRRELENFRFNRTLEHSGILPLNFDWYKSVAELDEQFYRLFDFAPEMIRFTEARYHYDDLHDGKD